MSKTLITKDNFNYQLIEDTKVEPLYQGYNCIIEEKVFYAKQLAKTGFYKLDGLYFNTRGNIFKINENNQYGNNYNPLNLFVMKPLYETHQQTTKSILSCGFYYIKRNKQEVFDKRKLKSKTPWKTSETLFYTDNDYSFLQEYKGLNYIHPSSYVILNNEIYKKPEYTINNSILDGKDKFVYESWYSRYYSKKDNPTYHIEKTSDSSWVLKDVIDKREEGFNTLFD